MWRALQVRMRYMCVNECVGVQEKYAPWWPRFICSVGDAHRACCSLFSWHVTITGINILAALNRRGNRGKMLRLFRIHRSFQVKHRHRKEESACVLQDTITQRWIYCLMFIIEVNELRYLEKTRRSLTHANWTLSLVNMWWCQRWRHYTS